MNHTGTKAHHDALSSPTVTAYRQGLRESLSLSDQGQMEERDGVLEELDALWPSMSEDECVAAKILAKCVSLQWACRNESLTQS